MAGFDLFPEARALRAWRGRGRRRRGALGGGRARYLYILEAGAQSPGVPPNLDKPDGTLWLVDTVPAAIPMKTGDVTNGVLPEGTKISVPDAGPPAALIDGEPYYIYAMADIGVPVTRCIFTLDR